MKLVKAGNRKHFFGNEGKIHGTAKVFHRE